MFPPSPGLGVQSQTLRPKGPIDETAATWGGVAVHLHPLTNGGSVTPKDPIMTFPNRIGGLNAPRRTVRPRMVRFNHVALHQEPSGQTSGRRLPLNSDSTSEREWIV